MKSISSITKYEVLKGLETAASARRLQFENLLWQVPMIAITGESFLFTIILNSATSKFSRSISSILAMSISFATLFSFARLRASEVHDSNKLAEIETKIYGFPIHGSTLSKSRADFVNKQYGKDSSGFFKKFFDKLIVLMNSQKVPTYPIWMTVFISFFLLAALCLLLNFIAPSVY